MAKRRKCSHCKKAPALRLKELCGCCEMILDGAFPDGHRPACWPMTSVALAVGTSLKELKAAHEIDRKAGVPTDYDHRGRPILRDRAHRKAYCRAHGAVDYDGGYGDA
jgi:hypothetical protein